MKICFLNPQGYIEAQPPLGKTDTGGQTVYVLELARALGRQGAQVDIVTRRFEGRPETEEIGPNARIVRIPCGPDRFVVKEKLYELVPEMVAGLREFVRRNSIEYDVAHSHYWDGGYAGSLLQRELGVPHVFTPHSLGKWKQIDLAEDVVHAHELDRLYRYQVRAAVEQEIMHEADAVLMLSERQRAKLMQHYDVDPGKTSILYPGVDTHVFNTTRNPGPKHRSLPTKNNVLVVSRFVPAKGIDRAIAVLALAARRLDCHLYIVTANESDHFSEEEVQTQRDVQEMVQKLALGDRVNFLGHIADREVLAEYYRATDIFLVPSRYEPFGLTTIEALACGAVAVVSHVAGSCELLEHGVNGFIVDIDHEEIRRQETADLLIGLLLDEQTRRSVSKQAALTVQRHLSWDAIAAKLLTEIYPTVRTLER
jgi:mannosylfructose-phosphate synthase